MGQSVAALHVTHGIPVTMTDRSVEALRSAAENLENIVAQFHSRLTDPSTIGPLFKVVDSVEGLAEADLVIEAVTENRRIKQEVLASLESSVEPTAVIASNTSTIPIAALGACLQVAERFCGLHFCHPVHARRLVEVISGDRTSRRVLDSVIAHADALDRFSIEIKDSPAFLVNRMLWPYLDEGLELLLDGVDVDDIESAAVEFGMPAGPIECLDEFGVDVSLRCGAMLRRAFLDRVEPSLLLVHLYESRVWGHQSGRSLFGIKASVDRRSLSPEMEAEVKALMRPPVRATRVEITDRLFLRMVVEATRLLEERVADGTHSIELALEHGLGLSRADGGLLGWSDAIGLHRVFDRLKRLAPLGRRFDATKLLVDMAQAGCTFSGDANRFRHRERSSRETLKRGTVGNPSPSPDRLFEIGHNDLTTERSIRKRPEQPD
jgi:3-hydroxyacyl-CoA dehydrogenase/enoyl-CoA hydratase/3-hydroxybutyryl-CoA epimerase/3-hydroxyacyl-CoA dehydrogenase/enoyl-CoA hydratase/3-hydroxybutyryl-CoA epimerase/enoyl-CoA isomerase